MGGVEATEKGALHRGAFSSKQGKKRGERMDWLRYERPDAHWRVGVLRIKIDTVGRGNVIEPRKCLSSLLRGPSACVSFLRSENLTGTQQQRTANAVKLGQRGMEDKPLKTRFYHFLQRKRKGLERRKQDFHPVEAEGGKITGLRTRGK